MRPLPVEEFEIGPVRPPSEGGRHALLLRFTRNCPWGRCAFCGGQHYQGHPFQLRSLDEIQRDIDKAKAIYDLIAAVSRQLEQDAVSHAELADQLFQADSSLQHSPSFLSVFDWVIHGARRVFIQDADSLIMPGTRLEAALRHLTSTFPSVRHISTYARPQTILNKDPEELQALKKVGLAELYMALDTGFDELLSRFDKGITAQELIRAGRRALAAGFVLTVSIMPGLGGKEMTELHARHTAMVLNAIRPHYIRSRPFAPQEGTALADAWSKGAFPLLTPHELLREFQILLGELTVDSRICFDHVFNPCTRSESGCHPLFDQGYEGYQLPEEKEYLLGLLENGLQRHEAEFVSVAEMARTESR